MKKGSLYTYVLQREHPAHRGSRSAPWFLAGSFEQKCLARLPARAPWCLPVEVQEQVVDALRGRTLGATPFGRAPHSASALAASSTAASRSVALTAAAAAEAEGRSWLGELVRSSEGPWHAVKLRKLLALCEQHGLHAEAEDHRAPSGDSGGKLIHHRIQLVVGHDA